MKLKLALFLIVVLLVSVMAEVVLAQMGGTMGKGHGKAFDMMQQGKNMRAGQGMQGLGFMHSAGSAYGEYVTFNIDSKTGNVLNYGIAGVPLFNISVANFNYRSTSELGSLTRVSSTDSSVLIQLHDNPAAVINILTNKSISVTFTLADGVNATKDDNSVRIESGSLVGYIVGTGTITSTVSGTQVKVDAPANSAVVFRASPVNMPLFDHMHQRYSQEIARNRLGMEIAFGRNRTYNGINYSAGMRLRVHSQEPDRIRLLINSTNPAGRVIGINLDNSSLMIGARDRLRIHYDGMPLQCVNDPNIVFNGTDQPLCWISGIQGRVRAQMLIHVPNFSERTIDIVVEPEVAETTAETTITATEPLEKETPAAPGFGSVIFFAGLLTYYSLKRKRK